MHTGWYVSGQEQTKDAAGLHRAIRSARGSACCRRHPARSTDRVSRAPAWTQFWPSAGVTKGALYYHFDSKEALGYAVVEEVIAPDVHGKWVRPLQNGKDPIDALIGAVQRIPVRPEDVRGGCQLNNLAQEMSPLDAGFRKRLATNLRWLARGRCLRFARGSGPRKRSPRRGTR